MSPNQCHISQKVIKIPKRKNSRIKYLKIKIFSLKNDIKLGFSIDMIYMKKETIRPQQQKSRFELFLVIKAKQK